MVHLLDGRAARERVSPFSSGRITWLVTVFIRIRPVMACDLAWSKMATNNNEKRAMTFMVVPFLVLHIDVKKEIHCNEDHNK
jgi:hypothetical protein